MSMTRAFQKRAFLIGSVLIGSQVLGAPAISQTAAQLEQRYRSARAEMLADLVDPAKALAFAEAAVSVGDVRGAIAALERLLLIDPTLDNIRAELGLLYQKAGAPQIARQYLEGLEGAPPDIRARLDAELETAEQRLAPHRVSGSVSLATRYETNANAAPDDLLVFGVPAEIQDPEDEAQDDVSFAAGLDMEHLYDFGSQAATVLETDLALFGTQYVDVEDANIAYARLDTGPRFRLGAGDHAVQVRPYVGGSLLSLEREHYLASAAAGVEATGALDPLTFVTGTVEGRLNEYEESAENPNAEDLEGEEVLASLRLTREVAPSLFLSGQVYGGVLDANEDFESYVSRGAGVAATYALDNPIDGGLDPLGLRASVAYTRLDYDDPNPFIDPNTTQEDDRFDLRLGASLPVRPQWAATLALDYTSNDSTLPNDEFDNFRISLGVRYDFWHAFGEAR